MLGNVLCLTGGEVRGDEFGHSTVSFKVPRKPLEYGREVERVGGLVQ